LGGIGYGLISYIASKFRYIFFKS